MERDRQLVLDTDGGGPWGSEKHEGPGGASGEGGGGLGPRNPWTEPPAPRRAGRGRAGLSPAALEELLRRSRRRFRGGLPEPNDRAFWFWGIVSLIGLWLILTSLHRIDSGERGVVLRFGRYAGSLGPGLQVTLPAPVDQVIRLPIERVATLDVGAGGGNNADLLITGDGSLVDLDYTVRWKIRDAATFLFAQDPDQADDVVRRAVQAAMRTEVARLSLADTSAQQALLGERVAARAQTMLDADRSGILLVGLSFRKAALPAMLAETAKEVAAAGQRAQGALEEARGYAAARRQRAESEADSFNQVYAEYKLSPDVTRRRMYYDMMDDVLPRLDKTIVDAPGTALTLPVPPSRRPVDGAQP